MSVNKETLVDIMMWLGKGRRGASSEAMALAIAETETDKKDHPYDPDDFNRCLLFLDSVPAARDNLHKVARISKYWEALIERWSEIENCFLDEVGLDWSKAKHAPKTYALMREVLAPIENNDPGVVRFGNIVFGGVKV